MPISRHPSQEERAAYKAGDTSPGAALALTVHAERCAVCRVDIQSLVAPARGARVGRKAAAPVEGVESHALGELRQAPWRWLAPGLRAAELRGASGLGEAVYLLKLAPGRAVPPRALAATAQMVVLGGGLQDGQETLQAGDYVDIAAQRLRRAVARRPDGCICLVVTDGSWPGRRLSELLSPLRRDEGC
jgi:putative transcriptional regulator